MPSPMYPEYEFGPDVIGTAKPPPVSGVLQGVRAQQQKIADRYRQSLPAYSDQLYGLAERQARQQLDSNIQDVRKGYNRRGLLHSGARQGAEGAERAKTASGLLDTRSSINQALYGRANEMENNLFNTDLGIAGNAPGLGAASLNGLSTDIGNEISDLKNQQSIYTGAGQGVGSVLGQIQANRRNSVYG